LSGPLPIMQRADYRQQAMIEVCCQHGLAESSRKSCTPPHARSGTATLGPWLRDASGLHR
jgi:hypothetical protein